MLDILAAVLFLLPCFSAPASPVCSFGTFSVRWQVHSQPRATYVGPFSPLVCVYIHMSSKIYGSGISAP